MKNKYLIIIVLAVIVLLAGGIWLAKSRTGVTPGLIDDNLVDDQDIPVGGNDNQLPLDGNLNKEVGTPVTDLTQLDDLSSELDKLDLTGSDDLGELDATQQ